MNSIPHCSQRDYAVYDDHHFCQDFVQMQGRSSLAYLLIDGLQNYGSVISVKDIISRIDSSAEIVINLAREEAILRFSEARTQLSKLIAALEKEGFLVIPNRTRSPSKRDDLMQLGMGYFGLFNIMMFASADYFSGPQGIPASFYHLFRWAGCVFSTLTILYLGESILRLAMVGLKRRQLLVEHGILFAIIVTWGYSTWNTFKGAGPVWFDSATMVLVLLVTSRFIQRQLVERAVRKSRGYIEASSEFVRILEDGQPKQIRITSLKKDDLFRVLPGELIPVAAKLVSEKAELSYSALTGEPDPQMLVSGMITESGAVNLRFPSEFIAQQDGKESWIHKTTSDCDRLLYERSSISEWTDKASSYFFVFVVLFAGLCFFVYHSTPEEAMSRAVSILLIACPCAFAIAIPLAYSSAIAVALRNGISFKSQETIEQAAKIERIIFDKTGTLTQGHSRVSDAKSFNQNAHSESLIGLLSSLTQFSHHHVALAVTNWAQSLKTNQFFDSKSWKCQETVGAGLTLSSTKDIVKIGRHDFVQPASGHKYNLEAEDFYTVYVSLNGDIVWGFKVSDLAVEDVGETIGKIMNMGIKVEILSGDQKNTTVTFAKSLGVDTVHYETSAEEKFSYLQSQNQQTAMVGNGWNDMKAMSSTSVSIAVHGATQALRDRASISLSRPGIDGVLKSIHIAKYTRNALLVSFWFALSYNVVGIILGFLGILTPLIAAITMPINSLYVCLIAAKSMSQFKLDQMDPKMGGSL